MSSPRSDSALVQRSQAEARVSARDVQSQLSAARDRLRAQVEALEREITNGVGNWRGAARRHPLLVTGAALLLGYVVGRLLSRHRE